MIARCVIVKRMKPNKWGYFWLFLRNINRKHGYNLKNH